MTRTTKLKINSPKPEKSGTIFIEMKQLFLLFAEIIVNFFGYLPFKPNKKFLTFP